MRITFKVELKQKLRAIIKENQRDENVCVISFLDMGMVILT